MLAFSNLTGVAGSTENLNVQNILRKCLYISENLRYSSPSFLWIQKVCINYVDVSDFVNKFLFCKLLEGLHPVPRSGGALRTCLKLIFCYKPGIFWSKK
jgi:hypothetical protein